MAKIYIAKEETSQQILNKISVVSIDLTKVDTAVADFNHDSLTITKGGLDSEERRITTN